MGTDSVCAELEVHEKDTLAQILLVIHRMASS